MLNLFNLPPILDFNEESKKGTLFDTRDGQSYPVVKIGKQIWTAENFRYLPSLEKGDIYKNSMLPDNSYLEKGNGRFYDFDTANHIAPEGWRLPSNKDFIELKDFIIKDNNLNENKYEVGCYLKSINDWELVDDIVNNDKYGFNAKPAGYGNTFGHVYSEGYRADFWVVTNIRGVYCLNYLSKGFGFNDSNSYSNGYSVRLIKTK